jgi:hypothetical protein
MSAAILELNSFAARRVSFMTSSLIGGLVALLSVTPDLPAAPETAAAGALCALSTGAGWRGEPCLRSASRSWIPRLRRLGRQARLVPSGKWMKKVSTSRRAMRPRRIPVGDFPPPGIALLLWSAGASVDLNASCLTKSPCRRHDWPETRRPSCELRASRGVSASAHRSCRRLRAIRR